MEKKLKFLKGILVVLVAITLIIGLFISILFIGQIFIKNYGDISKSYNTLGINDIIIYTIYVIQLVVTAILSFMVYKLSKSNEERVIWDKRLEKMNAIKYIKNEINYNKSMISVLKKKNVDLNKVNKYLFKSEAWDKYNIVLLELLDMNEYNLILSYYSTIQLYGIKELKDEVNDTINNTDKIFEIFRNAMKKLN
ncbi:MAG: hypothetical protein ACRCYC_06520 [Paraclostridium sp.]|uniref:hypothetical protein n=1 Tax=Paraclostridium sp. TaxID=2023273 RepID=UPI003F3BC37F